MVYSDVAQPDQTDIAALNCDMYLESQGLLFMVVKASSIDALKSKQEVFRDQVKILESSKFNILEVIDLEPVRQEPRDDSRKKILSLQETRRHYFRIEPCILRTVSQDILVIAGNFLWLSNDFFR